ncbi:hypothetical protein THASP1DRAFT_28743 [Thamnocephalis sphaerospora]|uniref:Ragulator complex protein LAMTOR1 n=1 Tax=Thamnocephalis sphaerospora TaxID=78915 RepID=A0A4P9XTF8_9FUNG|nr:hypothetical protein THASP1DRAFT_28743 [Thamnocephalis sphaerospora]|eukprot:RKP09464.1 hypothetical protein THASP1DRAFT_28743 [Thamnocephalis sphaerospora]
MSSGAEVLAQPPAALPALTAERKGLAPGNLHLRICIDNNDNAAPAMTWLSALESFYLAVCSCGTGTGSRELEDEQCGLLDNRQPNSYDGSSINRMSLHSQESLPNRALEQEALRRIVERTAENLIDVTGAGVERLQQADLAERTDEYQDVVGRIGDLSKANHRLNALPHTSLPVTEVLMRDAPAISSVDAKQMQQWAKQARAALDAAQVEHVGDLVVSLTWTVTE